MQVNALWCPPEGTAENNAEELKQYELTELLDSLELYLGVGLEIAQTN